MQQQSEKFSINLKNTSLFTVLETLQKRTDYRFFYDRKAAKKFRIEQLKLANITLNEILDYLKDNYPIAFQLQQHEVTVQIEHPEIASIKQELLGKTKEKVKDLNSGNRSSTLDEVSIHSTVLNGSIEGFYKNQKLRTAMSNGISAAQTQGSPYHDAALLLKRISGLQLLNNKFAIIRGLGDRYNNFELNGATLPSSEPNQRNFSFDLIPSFLIDYIIVIKTGQADQTSEFTGGLVQIMTKDIPGENFTSLGIETGMNSRTTGKSFISLGRSAKNYLGFGDTRVEKPYGMSFSEYDILQPQLDNPQNIKQRQQAASFLSTIPNNWMMHRYIAEPIRNYQLQFGRTIPLGTKRMGLIASVNYRNEQDADQHDQYYPTIQDYKGTDYSFTSTWGSSLNLAYVASQNKVSFKNTYKRSFNDLLYGFNGRDILNNAEVNNYTNTVIISQLYQSTLSGEHTFGLNGLEFKWQGSLSHLDREQPFKIMDRRKTGNPNQPEEYYDYYFNDRQASLGSLYYSDLKERLYSWSASLQVPLRLFNMQQKIKAGYLGTYRKAVFDANLYRIKTLPQASGNLVNFSGFAYNEVYNQTNFANSMLYLYPISGSGKDVSGNLSGLGYSGFQQLNTWYGMIDLQFPNGFRLNSGMRSELNNQQVSSYNPAMKTDAMTRLNKWDWLPSMNLVYALNSKVNIRGAWYKTVARPDLRELSYFDYFDPLLMRSISGSHLKGTAVYNYDLRYEYYPGAGEILSASLFYKKFQNPIELQLLASTGKPAYRYLNLKEAEDVGLEIEFRKSATFVASNYIFFKQLYFSGSLTWLKGRVQLDQSMDSTGTNHKRDRPLYGQSPYIINSGLEYTGKKFGLNLFYNRYGKRIIYAASSMSENEYESPRDMADLQFSCKLFKQKRAELKVNVINLLNQTLFTYKNQYGPAQSAYTERSPSIQDAPGVSYQLTEGQADPKGSNYNSAYDVVTGRKRSGTTCSIHLSYRL
ncbi:TonB-dependent receptor [Arcticibacter svalbardensis MN12-7]|uniref:TonB-dependent receptor n=1 Tax=Arcticibacter svalbardensis MN12-7 TaxID=1150600 RepID=R9GXR0_9SPHI|nr:TonB-dependent receptor [Arcticibacter svalbardensis MN12-7]